MAFCVSLSRVCCVADRTHCNGSAPAILLRWKDIKSRACRGHLEVYWHVAGKTSGKLRKYIARQGDQRGNLLWKVWGRGPIRQAILRKLRHTVGSRRGSTRICTSCICTGCPKRSAARLRPSAELRSTGGLSSSSSELSRCRSARAGQVRGRTEDHPDCGCHLCRVGSSGRGGGWVHGVARCPRHPYFR